MPAKLGRVRFEKRCSDTTSEASGRAAPSKSTVSATKLGTVMSSSDASGSALTPKST